MLSAWSLATPPAGDLIACSSVLVSSLIFLMASICAGSKAGGCLCPNALQWLSSIREVKGGWIEFALTRRRIVDDPVDEPIKMIASSK